nr:hypothetical protein [Tanacetum cinerariifolium]
MEYVVVGDIVHICRVEDRLIEGLIQGSVMHFHMMRTVTVPLMGIVSTSRMGRTGGVGRGHLLSNGIGSRGGYGGGNDSTAAGGVIAIGSLEHPISSLSVDGSLTANGGCSREGTSLVLKGFMGHFECRLGTHKNVTGSDRSLCFQCAADELPHHALYVPV